LGITFYRFFKKRATLKLIEKPRAKIFYLFFAKVKRFCTFEHYNQNITNIQGGRNE